MTFKIKYIILLISLVGCGNAKFTSKPDCKYLKNLKLYDNIIGFNQKPDETYYGNITGRKYEVYIFDKDDCFCEIDIDTFDSKISKIFYEDKL
jgi:hypothetical protein